MAADQEVTVKFLSDTKGYVKGVNEATKSQDKLNRELKETNTEQKLVVNETGLMTDSLGDMNTALTQTSEGLIDSATGMSGLGAAMTSIGTRVRSAVTALSSFQKALIATGIGAAVAALALILVYWEDIAEFIGIATVNLEKYDEQLADSQTATNLLIADLERQQRILTAMGLTSEAEAIEQTQLEIRIKGAQDEIDILNDKVADMITNDISGGFWNQLLGAGLRAFAPGAVVTGGLSTETATKIKEINDQIVQLDETIKDAETSLAVIGIGEDAALEASLGVGAEDEEEDEFLFNFSEEAAGATIALAQETADLISQLTIDADAEVNANIQRQRELDTKNALEATAIKSKADRDAAREEIIRAQQVEFAKQNLFAATFALATELAGENAQAQLVVDLAFAAANTAVGITKSFSLLPPANFINAAAVAVAGVAQTAAIIKAYNQAGVTGGGGLPSNNLGGIGDITTRSNADRQRQLDFENEQFNSQANRSVLVTEDLDRVQGRVEVTSDRSSI